MQEEIAGLDKKKQYRNLLGTIARQSQWVFAGKVCFVLLGFAISIVFARILGPTLLGRYQLGITVIQIATIFSVVGLDRGLIRFLPILQMKNSSEARALFGFTIQFSLPFSVALSTAIYFAAPLLASSYLHSEEMIEVLRVFSIYLPVFSVFRIASGGMVGIKRADVESNIANVFSPVVLLFLLLVIYFWGGKLVSCILARSFTHLIGAGVLIYFLLKDLPRCQKHLERSVTLPRFLSYSSSLMLIGLIYFLLGNMDIIMLGYFVAASEVGIYSVALKVATFVIFGLQVILPIVAPHFSEISERGDFITLESIFKTVAKWVFYSGLFVFVLAFILRADVLNVFGEEFVVGGSVLVILSMGNLANAVSGPTGQLLVMTGKQKWEMLNITLMIILNFLLNLLLIPRMGTIGAAIATAFSVSAINGAKLIEVYLVYRIHPYSTKCLKGILAISCGCLACYIIRLIALGGGLGYVSVIILTGIGFSAVAFTIMWILGFDEEDKTLIEVVRHYK